MNLSQKNIQAWTGFEPMTSAIPMQCSTSWAIKQLGTGPTVSSESQQGQLEFRIHWEFRTEEIRNVQKTQLKKLHDTSSQLAYCNDPLQAARPRSRGGKKRDSGNEVERWLEQQRLRQCMMTSTDRERKHSPAHLVSWDACTGIVPLLLDKCFLLRVG